MTLGHTRIGWTENGLRFDVDTDGTITFTDDLTDVESLSPGGRLTVTTAWAPDTRMLTVTFEDTGAGMSEETLARIFDLFFTTKPQGTGLGMAISRSVLDLHGGELTVHSVQGQGTRVVARLPLETVPGREGTTA